MKTITVKLTIKNIDKWEVDWSNQAQTGEELKTLSKEIQHAIADKCGIDYMNIEVNSELKQ